jgi:hypothetical protein
MPRFTIRFEMSDAMMSRAVRKDCVALADHAVNWRTRKKAIVATCGSIWRFHRRAKDRNWQWLRLFAPFIDTQGNKVGLRSMA